MRAPTNAADVFVGGDAHIAPEKPENNGNPAGRAIEIFAEKSVNAGNFYQRRGLFAPANV